MPDIFPDNRLGFGYKSFANKFGARVIDTGVSSSPPSGSRTILSFGLIGSQEDFERAFSADAAVSAGSSAFSIDARTGFSDHYSRSLTSVTIALTKQVLLGSYFLDITKYPLDNLAKLTAREHPSNYVQSFGDQVVTSVGIGGACCYMFQFNFASEKEAKEFKATIGGGYASFTGSLSAIQTSLLAKTATNASLAGYSTGTAAVPPVLPKDFTRSEDTSFLFKTQFAANMITNLLTYFDNFDNYFRDNPQHYPQYSQVQMQFTSLYELPEALLPNHDKLVKLAERVVTIAKHLDQQEARIEQLQSQLQYMTDHLVDFNTGNSLEEAKVLHSSLGNIRQKIGSRRDALTTKLNLSSAYDFFQEIPVLPKYFWTTDPDAPTQVSYTLSGNVASGENWTIYYFDIKPEDFGKTCRVEAQVRIAQYDSMNWGRAGLLMLKKKADSTPPPLLPNNVLADVQVAWDVIEQQVVACGHNSVKTMALQPIKFIPSLTETYAVAAYCWEVLPDRGLTLKTFHSR